MSTVAVGLVMVKKAVRYNKMTVYHCKKCEVEEYIIDKAKLSQKLIKTLSSSTLTTIK